MVPGVGEVPGSHCSLASKTSARLSNCAFPSISKKSIQKKNASATGGTFQQILGAATLAHVLHAILWAAFCLLFLMFLCKRHVT